MARKIKQGLDYVPIDINQDDKIEFLEAEHPITGWYVWTKLLQLIYANNYYLEWSLMQQKRFANKIHVDINTIEAVLNTIFETELLNKELYQKYNILTSSGIQKRYFKITERRERTELHENFKLVDWSYLGSKVIIVTENGAEIPLSEYKCYNNTPSTVHKGKEVEGKESEVEGKASEQKKHEPFFAKIQKFIESEYHDKNLIMKYDEELAAIDLDKARELRKILREILPKPPKYGYEWERVKEQMREAPTLFENLEKREGIPTDLAKQYLELFFGKCEDEQNTMRNYNATTSHFNNWVVSYHKSKTQNAKNRQTNTLPTTDPDWKKGL